MTDLGNIAPPGEGIEMPESSTKKQQALLVMGCPEVPVQMAIGLYIGRNLRKDGMEVVVTGNPAVLNLVRASDPDHHYLEKMLGLDRCIGEIVEKKRTADFCVAFAHNDAGISYAATMRHLIPGRLIVIIFGRNAEELAEAIDFPCEMVVEKAVHNPVQLQKKVKVVFGWDASKT
jgi:threonyl-tRNA synthetase